MKAYAIEGMESEFPLIPISKVEAQLENSYYIAMEINEFIKILKFYTMEMYLSFQLQIQTFMMGVFYRQSTS